MVMPNLAAALDRLIRAAAVVLLLSLLACVVVGVVSRQVGSAVAWSDEMAQYLLVWTGFVGWMIAARRRTHIRIGVFVDRLPRPARLAAEIVIQLAVILLCLLLLRLGTPLIERNWDVEWVSLQLPAGLLYLPIPFAAAAVAGQAVVEIIEALRGRIAGDPDPGAQPL